MLIISDLSMRFGGKILFKNVSLQFNPGRHYGLIGANGCGKSTFLKIVTGEVTPEKGDITIPTQVKIGTLKQDHFLYEDVSILDVVLQGNVKLWSALETKNKLLQSAHFSDKECHSLEALEKIIEDENGYAAPSEAGKILEGLGIPEHRHSHPLRVLSGGYKLRVLLAQVLFSRPDILLLDEPTNHLDIISIQWLETYLKQFPGMILVTSHDRHFLNAVCTDIVDVDYQTLKIYKGNFDEFEQKKTEDRELKESTLQKQERKRDDIQEFIDRFRAKSSKARQAQSKMKLVEKMEAEMSGIDLSPTSRMYPRPRFEICRPSGAIALTAQDLSKSYGEKRVLNHITFEIERGDRVAFIGPNGIGKSTLLEILTASINSDAGSFKWGHAVQIAYFPQDHAREMREGGNLLEWLGQFDRTVKEESLREILGRVLFSGDDVKKSIHILSGGETARLILAKMMVLKHNVLVFDEPTNHLDMESATALLEAMKNYAGTILLVSHNRHFVSHMATRIFEMTDHGLRDFRCTYDEYLAKEEEDHLSAVKSLKAKKEKEDQEAKNLSKTHYGDQKFIKKQKAQLEKKAAGDEALCQKYEKAIADIDIKMAAEGFYAQATPEAIRKLTEEKNDLIIKLATAFDVWEESLRQLDSI